MYRATDTPDNTISVNEPQEPKREWRRLSARMLAETKRIEADGIKISRSSLFSFAGRCNSDRVRNTNPDVIPIYI